MNDFVHLVQQCLKSKRGAKLKLWRRVEPSVRPALHGLGLFLDHSTEKVEDWLDDFYLWLTQKRQLRSLLCFHGDRDGDLREYLRSIAQHWLTRYRGHERAALRHEAKAIREHDQGEIAGPSLEAIAAVLLRLRAALRPKDRRKLAFFLGEYEPARKLSARTVQRWRKDLYKKCLGILRGG
jgi:hypothetical protein